jgi:hypothetical protein
VRPAGLAGVWTTETVEAVLGSPLADLMDEAALALPLPAPAAGFLVLIDGALSSASQLHRKNSPRHELYGLQGLPLTYFRSFVNQKRRTSSIRSRGSSEVPMAAKALGLSR